MHLAEVQMWVFEEYVKLEDGKWIRPARGAQPPAGKTWVDEGYEPLTEVINRLNENVIYLPGIKLPKSIIAQPDIKKCVTNATMMVFVIPHNFLAPIVPKMEARRPASPPPRNSRAPWGAVLRSAALILIPAPTSILAPTVTPTLTIPTLTLCRAPSPRVPWASR